MSTALCRFLLWIAGWKVNKTVPDEVHRCIMISAPHTTNWDGYFIKLALVVLGIDAKVAIKDTWTKGIVGWFVKAMGGIGVNRKPKVGTERLSQTEAMANLFKEREKLNLAIAPEGTRKRRERWKMGFYWIAHEAQVPITMGYLDYENKIAGVGPIVVHTTGDLEADMPAINDFYRDIKGKNPNQFSVDLRYEPKTI